jgi:hypothetical protein
VAHVDASFCSNRYIAQLWIRPGFGRVSASSRIWRAAFNGAASLGVRCTAPRRGRWEKLLAARLLRTKQQLAWLREMPPTRGYPHRWKGRHESPNFGKPCDRLVDGESLRSICSDAWMPSRGTVFRWIACRKEFRDEYTLAREVRAEDLAEEMVEIADDPCVWVEKIRPDGRSAP